MHHVPITISKDAARDLYRAYQKHLHYSTPIDREVMSAYQKLAQGKLVIKALESITTAGADDKGSPPGSASSGPDAKLLTLTMYGDGSARMTTAARPRHQSPQTFNFVAKTFPDNARWRNAEAVVPQAPLHLRPKRAMQNHHVLFEADWTRDIGPAARSVPAAPDRPGRSLAGAGDVGPHRSGTRGADRKAVNMPHVILPSRTANGRTHSESPSASIQHALRTSPPIGATTSRSANSSSAAPSCASCCNWIHDQGLDL